MQIEEYKLDIERLSQELDVVKKKYLQLKRQDQDKNAKVLDHNQDLRS